MTSSGPSLVDKFPRTELLYPFPTPIHPLKRLSEHLGGKVNLYAKREDTNSGIAYGGNKTRKLEYLMPDAIKGGYTHLVSIGGIQSNQTRQVAAVAAHLGLKCVLVQENWVNHTEDEKTYNKTGNVQLSRILGADVRFIPEGFDIGIRKSLEDAVKSVEAEGGKPFPIPAGCSMHHKGALGFVRFTDEVRQQEKDLGVKFDYVVVCAVTGSTQAGMIVGFKSDTDAGARKVIGIDASAKPQQTRDQILNIAQHTAGLVELDKEINEKDVILDERFGGPEYGIPSEGTLEAIRLCARKEGMLTDPVYEGKSMHAMIEMVKNGEFKEGSNVLYVHLGGVPALSAYGETFKDG